MDKEFFALSRLYLHKVIAVDREFEHIYILFLQNGNCLGKGSAFKRCTFVRQRLVIHRFTC